MTGSLYEVETFAHGTYQVAVAGDGTEAIERAARVAAVAADEREDRGVPRVRSVRWLGRVHLDPALVAAHAEAGA